MEKLFSLRKSKKGIVEFFNDNKILIILFGGFDHGLGIKGGFSTLIKFLKDKKFDIIHIRDFNQIWYHTGVEPAGKTIDDLAVFLQKKIKNYHRTITWGNSMGGYAAILFGSLIDSDLCFAFVPTTFIDIKNRKRYNDNRNAIQKDQACKFTKTTLYLDLKKYFEKKTNNDSKTHFFLFGAKDFKYNIHSLRMLNIDNFHLFNVNSSKHNSSAITYQVGVINRLIESITINQSPYEILKSLQNENVLELQHSKS